MASGTITGSFSGGTGAANHEIYISWSQTAGTGGSTVKATLYAGQSKTWGTYKANASYSLSIDGTATTGTYNYDERSYTGRKIFKIAEASVWVTHTAAADITIEGSLDLSGTTTGTGSASGTASLDPVTVYYTITCYDYTTSSEYLGTAGSTSVAKGGSISGSDWGTSSPYSYYDYSSCTSIESVSKDDSVYRYFSPSTLTVYCYDSYAKRGDLGAQEKTITYFDTFRGSDWGDSKERDVYYSGYTYNDDDGETSPKRYNWCVRYFDKSVYSVTCIDYDDLGNQIGTQTAKSYTYGSTAKGSDWGTTAPSGYTYSTCSEVNVTSDTEVTRTFNRNYYTVYEYDVVDSKTGTVLGYTTASKQYKEEVRGSDISSATYAGYHYIEDTSCEVSTTASNNKVYRIFNANEYMLEYDLGPGAEEEPLPRSATYNQWLKIPDPVRLGYELEGWNLSGMSYDTHYYSPDGSTKHSFTGSTASKIYGPYFMNLTSDENGTVYLEAVWKAKGLGRIYLESDKKYHSALCFIYHDGKYYQAIPYIYHDDKYRIGG